MITTQAIRLILKIGGVFNLAAALMLAFPTTLGKFGDLPVSNSIFHTLLLSLLVGFYGLVYFRLAYSSQIDRPLLTIAGIGKISVFVLALYCWQTEAITFRAFSTAIGDLIFGVLFIWWLLSNQAGETP
jgi:hypothetical protein